MSVVASPAMPALAGLVGEIGDLKRVRAAHLGGSVAAERFTAAWRALAGGADVESVALSQTANAVAGARLGAIDARVLASAGTAPSVTREVLERAFDAVAHAVPEPLRAELRGALGPDAGEEGTVPPWVDALRRQPRAGATRPGHARLMLQPEESHAEHCFTVAVGAVLAAPQYGLTDVGAPFLCGLAHHLHNAVLPDSGFAGEALLGAELEPLIDRLTHAAVAELPDALRGRTGEALELRVSAASRPARAFHAADVLDRVLEMRHHARTAAFTVEQALEELELVHEGPVQAFGLSVLDEAGLR